MQKLKSDVASHATTLEDLAQRVGRCVRTIQRARKRSDAPRCTPGKYSIAAWEKYFAEHGRDRLPDNPETRALKLRKLFAEVEDREHRVAELRKQFVRRSAVDERWQFHRERCVAVLNEMLDKFSVEIVGCDAVQIRKAAEHFVDHFTMRMRSGN
jgi:transposase InsO family protein